MKARPDTSPFRSITFLLSALEPHFLAVASFLLVLFREKEYVIRKCNSSYSILSFYFKVIFSL